MDPNTMGLPTGTQTVNPSTTGPVAGAPMNGYRCGSNTSSSSGRGSSIQHASLPRHFSNNRTSTAGQVMTSDRCPPVTSDMTSPMSEVPIITNGLPNVSAHHIPLQHHNLAYNTANKNRPNYNHPGHSSANNQFATSSYYYHHRPSSATLAPSSGGVNGISGQQPHHPTHQYNSHYRGPPLPGPQQQPPLRKPLNNAAATVHHNTQPQTLQPQSIHGNGAMTASDYAILKFNSAQNGVNVGKEIDV